MADQADPLRALRTLLLADAAVADAVADRVFGDELNRNQNASMPQAAVVLAAAGGPNQIGNAFQAHSDFRLDVICYGATINEARLTYLAVRSVLKNVRRTVSEGCLIHWARVTVSGHTGRDPETQWPACISVWQVLAADETVT